MAVWRLGQAGLALDEACYRLGRKQEKNRHSQLTITISLAEIFSRDLILINNRPTGFFPNVQLHEIMFKKKYGFRESSLSVWPGNSPKSISKNELH